MRQFVEQIEALLTVGIEKCDLYGSDIIYEDVDGREIDIAFKENGNEYIVEDILVDLNSYSFQTSAESKYTIKRDFLTKEEIACLDNALMEAMNYFKERFSLDKIQIETLDEIVISKRLRDATRLMID